MTPESQMQDLANRMTRAHGALKEVVFLVGNKNIILVFSDGTTLPTDCAKVDDGRGSVIQAEFLAHDFYAPILERLNQSPLEYLAYGYSGTGPRCLSTFLQAAGFKDTDVESVDAPLRLRRDGSRVLGSVQDELIEWDDGQKMTNAGLGKMPEFIKGKLSWRFWSR